MSRFIKSIAISSLLLLTIGCDDDEMSEDQFASEIAMDCRGICVNMGCADGVVVPTCITRCLDRVDKAVDYGATCEYEYASLMQCLGELHDCGQGGSWNAARGGDSDYFCRTETEAFDAACPGLWPKGL